MQNSAEDQESAVPKMYDYWKKTCLTESDLTCFSAKGYLPDNTVRYIPEIKDYPLRKDLELPVFESHLIAGLGFPPSKFFESFCLFFNLEPLHLKTNVVSALSVFVMLCECWLGIPPCLKLFRYFHLLSYYRHDGIVHSIGVQVRRNKRNEYIPYNGRGSWRHDPSPILGRGLLPHLTEKKRSPPLLTPRLNKLIARVRELRAAGLHATHCAEEFIIRRIRPLGHRNKLAFACPRDSDPNRLRETGICTFFGIHSLLLSFFGFMLTNLFYVCSGVSGGNKY